MNAQLTRKQRGAISLLGAGAIALSLTAGSLMIEYGNAKLLDRELDNYARDVAAVALRSELAITQGMDDKGITDTTANAILANVGMQVVGDDNNLNKTIIFGNLDANGNFVALTANASNPRAAAEPPNFSAVAVQLWSSEKFLGVFTPEGRAIYGMDLAQQNSDSGCYCKNRYAACLETELTVADLSAIPAAQAQAIIVKNSDARKNYCNYGFTDSKVSDVSVTKYPHAHFDDSWIGRTPASGGFLMFYTKGYDDASFGRVLEHKPLLINNGKDPLNQQGGFMYSMMGAMMCFMPFMCPTDEKLAYTQSDAEMKKSNISPSSIANDYRCLKTGMMSSSVVSCSDSGFNSSSRKIVLHDSFYIGYQGTCVADTNALNMSKCLSYNESSTQRFQSCLDIERNSAMDMNFFQRMMAFFFGPILNWERSYEALNCEMKTMRYKGWMFWGGWKDV